MSFSRTIPSFSVTGCGYQLCPSLGPSHPVECRGHDTKIFVAHLHRASGAQSTVLSRVGVRAILDIPYLTPLSVASCGRLLIVEAANYRTSVALLQVVDNWPGKL